MSKLTLSQQVGLPRTAAAVALLLVIALGVLAWWSNAVGIMPTVAGIEVAVVSHRPPTAGA